MTWPLKLAKIVPSGASHQLLGVI